ncbi:baseplate J/gp47 family protein [Paenibacillus sp. RC84]|uniref:baseplate J/gp47 family protein n=1 Tax=Paenibacillus sp. RC84 TaxID=3156252 RepID=UPI003517E9D3
MLDEKGFKRKRFADLVVEMEDKSREAFGQKINTSEWSPLGIIIRLFAFFLAKLWAVAEDVYNGDSINHAKGVQLDRQGPRAGISRFKAAWAKGFVHITGIPGTDIAIGFVVATKTGVTFETTEAAIIAQNGEVVVPIVARDPGSSGNQAAGTITVIVNPNPNISSVTNAEPTGGGREKETDTEFRARFPQSVAGGGSGTTDSIRAELLRVEGVRAAAVIENYYKDPDAEGRPGKSVSAYVLGGDRQAIAAAIFRKRSGGIEPAGSEEEIVFDISGNPQKVRFTYAPEVKVYAKIALRTDESFPADGDALVRSALIRYIGGREADGSLWNGLNMGQDVVHWEALSTLRGIDGIKDARVELSTDGITYAPANIDVGPQQVAQADADRIEVGHIV